MCIMYTYHALCVCVHYLLFANNRHVYIYCCMYTSFQQSLSLSLPLSVQFDGTYVVSGAYDFLVKVWNPVDGSCMYTLQGHTNRVYSLLVSLYSVTVL